MADTKTTQKYRINRVVDENGNLVVVHPETEAGQVLYTGKIGTTDVANVDQALGALATLAQNSGVTGVKGSAESSYRKGNVNLTPANIGAVASNTAITAGTFTKVTVDTKGLVTGGARATLDEIDDGTTRKLSNYIPTSQKGANGGVATLGTDGKVPTSQLPSYVDDVLEYDNLSGFPTTGSAGKIYVDKQTNKTYRWSGSGYTEISASLALGETSSTAYAGDKGKANAQAISTLQTAVANITNGNTKVGKAADSEKLGGLDAEDYAKLTDIADLDGLYLVTGTVHSFSSWNGTGLNISENYSTIHTAISNGKVPVLKITASDNGDYGYFYFSYGELAEYDDEQDTIEFYCMYGRSKLLYITMDADGNIYANSRTLYNGVTDGAEATNLPIVSRIYDQNGDIKVTRRAMTNADLPTVSNLTAGSYSLVSVNTKGIVTGGNQLVQWGTSTNNTPSATLAVGGLFFELVE